ncbi:DUF4440 domain-containing protein [Dactylosporangium siamense]|uniref:DUF4440 domain-containing protein n=1 Tax=Dactylosporangium siamense TaxID=685454 RepID=A0A919PIE5_9ACTN|nr:nuclear transport factor 2 family protein [Dactylosporangium siamense]GIG45376.1 hypothetical protein Dsi01nite_034170 [Dactylosporangium siamense]
MTPAQWPTIRDALWIGGGQWSGKTTVGALLTTRHALTHYHCDHHDARAHEDRRIAARSRRGDPPPDWPAYWASTPQEMADVAMANFAEQFPWVLDDLRALVSPRPVLVDGWNLRPDLVAGVADAAHRMAILVPTPEWQSHQAATLPRAARFGADLPDPARARRNRDERDRILAADAADRASALGIRVIPIDGTRDPASIADELEDHFGLAPDGVAAAIAGELELMTPAVRASPELAARYLDPDFVEIGTSGRRWDRATTLATLPAKAGARYEPAHMRGTVLAPGLVQVTYETTIEGERALRSSLWRDLGDGSGWRLYYHQSTRVP